MATRDRLHSMSCVFSVIGSRMCGMALMLLRQMTAKSGAAPLTYAQLRRPMMLPSAFGRPETRKSCLYATPGHTTFTRVVICFVRGNSERHPFRFPFA